MACRNLEKTKPLVGKWIELIHDPRVLRDE